MVALAILPEKGHNTGVHADFFADGAVYQQHCRPVEVEDGWLPAGGGCCQNNEYSGLAMTAMVTVGNGVLPFPDIETHHFTDDFIGRSGCGSKHFLHTLFGGQDSQ